MSHIRPFLAVLALLASLGAFAATPGHPLTPVTYGPYGGSGDPLIASNGSAFVTVWTSGTSWATASMFASHLDERGQVDIAHAVKLPGSPQPYAEMLIPAGENFLLVWRASTNRYATLLRADLTVGTFELPMGYGSIAANANRILFVYARYDGSMTNLMALLLDTAGNRLAEKAMQNARPDSMLNVVADESGFTVITAGIYGIYAQEVALDGVASQPLQLFGPSRTSWRPGSVVAFRQSGSLFVAWTMTSIISAPDSLHGLLVDRDGHLVAQHQIEIPDTAVQLLAAERAADGFALFAHTGTWQAAPIRQLAVWTVSLTDRDFTATALSNVPEEADAPIRDVAVAGSAIVGVRTDTETAPSNERYPRIVATRLDDNSVEPQVVSIIPSRQSDPEIASDGVDFIVTWHDAGASERSALKVAAAGTAQGPPFTLPAGSVMAFGSSSCLVVWSSDSEIHGAFVLPSGTVVSTLVIHGQVPRQPSVIWDGQRFALVWTDAGEIFGTFVTPSGEVAQARQISSRKPTEAWPFSSPEIAWNGTTYLVAWMTDTSGAIVCTCIPPPQPAYLRLVNSDGIALGDPVVVDPDTSRIHLASDGNGFGLVAEHWAKLTFTNIEAFGEVPVLRNTIVVFEWLEAFAADLEFNGREYVIALRYSAPGAAVGGWLATTHIAGGTILQRRFTPVEAPADSAPPAIAANAAGESVLALAQLPSEVGTQRVYTFSESEFDELPPPPPPPTEVRASLVSCDPKLSYQCTVLTWSGSDKAIGYVVEQQSASGDDYYILRQTPAGVHQLTLSYAEGARLRVRAAGPGGLSNPSELASVGIRGRRRGARP